MTTKWKIAVAIVLGLCTSTPAFAITDVTTSGFTVWSTVYGNDVIRVGVTSSVVNPAGCTDPDSYMVLSTLSKEAKARTYATLLTGKALGKPVHLFISESACELDRPAIDTVTLD